MAGMSSASILIVAASALTRKTFRAVIEEEGFTALEAESGAGALDALRSRGAQLVLVDTKLPDMSGFDLARRLRSLPGGTETPVVALSGFLYLLENTRPPPETFDAFLFKPVEPDRLVETIRAFLPGGRSGDEGASRRRAGHILIVDDDPVQVEIAQLQLSTRFARVTSARGGAAALAQARRTRPDLILSDILMPGMDGFELCMAIRQDPLLTDIPIVLVSAHYDDPTDAKLALRVGANALASRRGTFSEVLTTIVEVLEQSELARYHVSRPRLQLERRLSLDVGEAQRVALQSAELLLLSRVVSALTQCGDVNTEIGEVLAVCLDAAGIDRGVLYRTGDPKGFCVSHVVGFGPELGREVADVFGHPDLLDRAVAESAPLSVTAPGLPSAEVATFLARAELTSALFVPLVGGGRRLGALLLGSSVPTPGDVQLPFCRSLAAHIGQALALSDVFAREQIRHAAPEPLQPTTLE